jgi:hypothetical protein
MSDPEKTEVAPEPQKETSGPHWSKDYVEHLRTVHFSLIALSLAAVVLALSPNPDEIKKAREQINAIEELVRVWDQRWIQKAAENTVADKPKERDPRGVVERDFFNGFVPYPEDANALKLTGTDSNSNQQVKTFKFQFTTPNWIIDGPARDPLYQTLPLSEDRMTMAYELLLSAPTTLAEFQNLWDTLNKKHIVRSPTVLSKNMCVSAKIVMVCKDTGTIEWVRFAPRALQATRTLEFELRLVRENVKQPMLSTSLGYGYFLGTGNVSLILPAAAEAKIDFYPQEGLIQHFAKGKPLGGSFEHSFPELNKITKNYQTLELDKFDPIFEAEQNRTGESFEAFGIKFPAEATTRWGILVILGVQLYFWIHLHELARKLLPTDQGWEVAFIGMYPSLPSKVVYTFSALVLPVGAIAALGIRGLYVGSFRWLYWLLLIMGITFSVTFAVLAWRSAPSREFDRTVNR